MRSVSTPSLAAPTWNDWRRGLALYLDHPVLHAGRWFGYMARRHWPGRLLRFTDGEGSRYVSLKPNFTSLAVAVLGQRDPNVMRFLRRWVRPGATACDVGANIGTYTLPLARLVGPHGRVLAFEPNRSTRACLRQNIRQNQLANVQVVGAAAGPTGGRARLVLTPSNLGEVHLAASPQAGDLAVDVTTLDAEVAHRGLARITFIKLDVEGYELAVLRGARRTLAAHPRVVVQTEIVAAHAARYGFTVEALIAFFADLDFRPHTCDDEGRMHMVPPGPPPVATDWFWAHRDNDLTLV